MGTVADRTVLKEGPLSLVTDGAGDVRALNVEGHGLYFEDTRFLSVFELDVSGARLVLLSAAGELNFMNNLQFANDTVSGDGGALVAAPHTISVRRNRFLHDGLRERLGLFNYNQHPVHLAVRLTFGSDFRDMFDVRGYATLPEHERGELLPPVALADGLLLRYRGRDGADRATRITFEPPPARIEVLSEKSRIVGRTEIVPGISGRGDPRLETPTLPPLGAAHFEVRLEPSQFCSISVQVTPERGEVRKLPDARDTLDEAFQQISASYGRWESAATSIETDHEVFDALVRRALHDLRLLTEEVEGDLVPTAGIPWFAVPFGRDSLITGIQTLSLRPEIARGTLRFLARYQGSQIDDFRDEQPGRILHEIRLGELARLGAVPHTPYYGSIDATPLFLVALGEYVRWTGDLALARELLPNAERALAWLDEYGDVDDDGFVEYQTRSARGIRNQGWKDSGDAVCHPNGALAEPPIALAEVQAYVFGARCAAAELFARLGQHDRARGQRARAESLRQQFVRVFAAGDERGAFWAMALDRDKRRVEAVSSNPGHGLWTGLLRGVDAERTVRRLMADDMLCGWGIRCLSEEARSFNPMSYHNGSVWPHDNGILALGMKRVGADSEARQVAQQVFEAAFRFNGFRMPELYCGFARDRRYHSMPAQYPVSCSPQAWAAGSVFMLLQALLGLEASALERTVRLRPLLPLWLGRVSLRKLRVGDTHVDLDVFREGHRTLVDVVDDGGLRVEVREAAEG